MIIQTEELQIIISSSGLQFLERKLDPAGPGLQITDFGPSWQAQNLVFILLLNVSILLEHLFILLLNVFYTFWVQPVKNNWKSIKKYKKVLKKYKKSIKTQGKV